MGKFSSFGFALENVADTAKKTELEKIIKKLDDLGDDIPDEALNALKGINDPDTILMVFKNLNAIDKNNISGLAQAASNVAAEAAEAAKNSGFSVDSIREAFAGANGDFSTSAFKDRLGAVLDAAKKSKVDDKSVQSAKETLAQVTKNIGTVVNDEVLTGVSAAGQVAKFNETMAEFLKAVDEEASDAVKAARKAEADKALDDLFAVDGIYDAVATSMKMTTSTMQRLRDGRVLETIKNGFKKAGDYYPQGGWWRTLANLGVFSAVIWTLAKMNLTDDVGSAFTDFLKTIIDVPVEYIPEIIELGGESLWELIKPFLLPIGIGFIFMIFVFFMMR